MQTSHFDPARLPHPQSFYEREIGKLTRPSRGWAQGRCPFHDSQSGKSFAVNLADGGFCCFGCQVKGGDVIDFLRMRYSLDFKTAAQEAGAWVEEMPSERSREIAEHRKREALAQERKLAQESAERDERIRLRNALHLSLRLSCEAGDRLTELHQGAAESFLGETEQCWETLALALESERLDESAYCLAAGMADPYHV
jgi:hypothetical protein